MGLIEVTMPAIEPVTLSEAKLACRVDHDSEDGMFDLWIESARRQVENFTGRQLLQATYDYTLDKFPPVILLPKPPLSSVTSIKYDDTNGTQQTLTASLYATVTSSAVGYVVPAYNQSWPVNRDDTESVIVRFVCGYGTTTASVPDDLRAALLMLVVDAYEHRGSQVETRLEDNTAAQRLLWGKRVLDFGLWKSAS